MKRQPAPPPDKDEDVDVPYPDTWEAIEDMIHDYVFGANVSSSVVLRVPSLGGCGSDGSKFSRNSN